MPKVFKLNSKKYMIEAEPDQLVTSAFIEFEEDGFSKIVSVPKNPETDQLGERNIFLDVAMSPIVNGKIVSHDTIFSHAIDLRRYADGNEQVVSLCPDTNVLKALDFQIQLVPVIETTAKPNLLFSDEKLKKRCDLLTEEVILLRQQATTQDMVKKKLISDSEELRQQIRRKDSLI